VKAMQTAIVRIVRASSHAAGICIRVYALPSPCKLLEHEHLVSQCSMAATARALTAVHTFTHTCKSCHTYVYT